MEADFGNELGVSSLNQHRDSVVSSVSIDGVKNHMTNWLEDIANKRVYKMVAMFDDDNDELSEVGRVSRININRIFIDKGKLLKCI